MSGAVPVTGASRGIGAATARLLARRGSDLALACRTPGEDVDVVAGHCRAEA